MGMKKKYFWGMVAALLLLTSHFMVGAAALLSDDFKDGKANGWSRSGGRWSVTTDANHVYRQAKSKATAYSYTGKSTWTDYTVQAKAKVIKFSGPGRSFGIVARYTSTNNYYYLSLSNANQLRLGKRSSKGSAVLASKTVRVSKGTWYTLKLEVTGTTLKGYVDDQLQLTAVDSTLTKGKCGLFVIRASAAFDDFMVNANSAAVTPTTTTNNNSAHLTIGKPLGWAAVNALGQNGTTGGAGGTVTHVYDKNTLEKVLYQDNNPAIIVIHGVLSGGPDMINVKGNKTIVGADQGAYLDFGFYLRGSNIIIKNLDMMNGGFNPGDSEGLDTVSFAQDLHHVWVDHCTMHETMDGLVDPTRNARFVTVSYCYFHTQKTACLIGGSDSDSAAKTAQRNRDKSLWHYTCTFHHNYWEGVYERAPRVRFGAVHVFNNYYNNNNKYAIGRGDRANIYSEANYFLNTHKAFAAYDDSSNPGYVEDVDSLFEGDNGATADNPPSGAWVWDPATYYSYTPHTAQWVKLYLKNYVGVGKGNPKE
jgi:pectate lyase